MTTSKEMLFLQQFVETARAVLANTKTENKMKVPRCHKCNIQVYSRSHYAPKPRTDLRTSTASDCGQVARQRMTRQYHKSISNIDDNFFYKMCIAPIPSAARLSGFLHTPYKQMFRQKIYRKTTKNLWQNIKIHGKNKEKSTGKSMVNVYSYIPGNGIFTEKLSPDGGDRS